MQKISILDRVLASWRLGQVYKELCPLIRALRKGHFGLSGAQIIWKGCPLARQLCHAPISQYQVVGHLPNRQRLLRIPIASQSAGTNGDESSFSATLGYDVSYYNFQSHLQDTFSSTGTDIDFYYNFSTRPKPFSCCST